MRNFFSKLMLTGSVMFLLTACSTTQKEHKGEIDIKAGTGDMSGGDLAGHKAFDIAVSSMALSDSETSYTLTYYHLEKDSVKRHGAMFGSSYKEKYDKAGYQWLDDTTVSIRLFNSKTGKAETFKAYGNGARNGMKTDK